MNEQEQGNKQTTLLEGDVIHENVELPEEEFTQEQSTWDWAPGQRNDDDDAGWPRQRYTKEVPQHSTEHQTNSRNMGRHICSGHLKRGRCARHCVRTTNETTTWYPKDSGDSENQNPQEDQYTSSEEYRKVLKLQHHHCTCSSRLGNKLLTN